MPERASVVQIRWKVWAHGRRVFSPWLDFDLASGEHEKRTLPERYAEHFANSLGRAQGRLKPEGAHS